MNIQDLKKPFDRDEIEWRIQSSGIKGNGEVWAKIIAYVQARAVMDRLDYVCGPHAWSDQYVFEPKGVMCGITIQGQIEGKGCYNQTKWDGAEPTQVESFKGGLSDAFKRAAVKWGIGRYLYSWEVQFAEISMKAQKGWNYASHKAKDGSYTKYWWKVPESAWHQGEPPEGPFVTIPSKLIKPDDNDSQLPNYAEAVGAEKEKPASKAYLKLLRDEVSKKSIDKDTIKKQMLMMFGKGSSAELTNDECTKLLMKFVRTYEVKDGN